MTSLSWNFCVLTSEQAADSGLASYVAGQIDRTLSWKDVKWLQTITTLPILVKGVITAEDSRLSLIKSSVISARFRQKLIEAN